MGCRAAHQTAGNAHDIASAVRTGLKVKKKVWKTILIRKKNVSKQLLFSKNGVYFFLEKINIFPVLIKWKAFPIFFIQIFKKEYFTFLLLKFSKKYSFGKTVLVWARELHIKLLAMPTTSLVQIEMGSVVVNRIINCKVGWRCNLWCWLVVIMLELIKD